MPQFLSTSPSGYIIAVTPSDTVNLAATTGFFSQFNPATRGLSITVLGTVSVLTATGQTVSFASGELLVGVIYGLSVLRVNSTGTTATGIKAYF